MNRWTPCKLNSRRSVAKTHSSQLTAPATHGVSRNQTQYAPHFFTTLRMRSRTDLWPSHQEWHLLHTRWKCPFHDHDFEPFSSISRSCHRLDQSWMNVVVVVDFQPHHSLRVYFAMNVLRYLGPSTHSFHITQAIIFVILSHSYWWSHNTLTCLDCHGSQGILAKILAKQLSVF